MAIPVGHRIDLMPVPPIPEHTAYFEAGGLTIALESRTLNPTIIDEYLAKHPERAKTFIETRSIKGTPIDEIEDIGVSIHVFDERDGQEYIRFDIFDNAPHYHYVHPNSHHVVVPYDIVANPDYLGWAFERLATSLPKMLETAGAADASTYVDLDAVRAILPRIRTAAAEAIATQRANTARAPEPTA